MKGMESWSNVAIVYCWLIQYAFIAVSIELRDTLIKKAQHWITLLPRQQIRMVLLLANTCAVLVLLSALWTLLKTIDSVSLTVAGELFLLLIQVWSLCGSAIPMSAKRFYIFFLKHPKYVKEKWILENKK